jgi:hypothetical protein
VVERTITLASDVLAVALRPDGKEQLALSTLDGTGRIQIGAERLSQ